MLTTVIPCASRVCVTSAASAGSAPNWSAISARVSGAPVASSVDIGERRRRMMVASTVLSLLSGTLAAEMPVAAGRSLPASGTSSSGAEVWSGANSLIPTGLLPLTDSSHGFSTSGCSSRQREHSATGSARGACARMNRRSVEAMELTEIPVKTIDGTDTTLAPHKGKVMLIVNVASRCGLAPQYEKLEAMQKQYGDAGFTVLGFPSNQFLQELGKNDAIKEYCSTTWGVTFPMFDRVQAQRQERAPALRRADQDPGCRRQGRQGHLELREVRRHARRQRAPLPPADRARRARDHRAHRVVAARRSKAPAWPRPSSTRRTPTATS